MDTVRVIHDPDGQSLTVWFGDPTTEGTSTEDLPRRSLAKAGEHGVIVMKDDAGRVIGVEIIGYAGTPKGVALELGGSPGALNQ